MSRNRWSIFMTSYGSGAGSDGFDITVTDNITLLAREKAPSVAQLVADKQYIDYGRMQKWLTYCFGVISRECCGYWCRVNKFGELWINHLDNLSQKRVKSNSWCEIEGKDIDALYVVLWALGVLSIRSILVALVAEVSGFHSFTFQQPVSKGLVHLGGLQFVKDISL